VGDQSVRIARLRPVRTAVFVRLDAGDVKLGVGDAARDKITRGNAAKLYGLDF